MIQKKKKKEKRSFESRNFGANKPYASSKEKNETEIAVASGTKEFAS